MLPRDGPVPRQEFVEPVDGVIVDAGEHIDTPSLRRRGGRHLFLHRYQAARWADFGDNGWCEPARLDRVVKPSFSAQ